MWALLLLLLAGAASAHPPDPETVSAAAGVKVVTATANLASNKEVLDVADIRAAVTACGTDRCRVDLVAGTYLNTCLALHNLHSPQLSIVGKGKGKTFLAPPLDLDACKGLTTGGAMITINTSENLELAYFTIDGNKEALREVPTCAVSPGAIGGCGLAIWVVTESGPAGNSKNISIHDLEIREVIGDAIASRNGEDIFVFHNELSELGCRQSDTPCGCLGDTVACHGWTAYPDLYGIAGFKTKGRGVAIDNDTQNSKVTNNQINRTTYPGIEVLQTYLNPLQGRTIIEDNDVVGTSIVVNGGVNVTIRRNSVVGSKVPGIPPGNNDSGGGLAVAANVTSNITIEDNDIVDSDSVGLYFKPMSGSNAVIRGNRISGSCKDHLAGGGGDLIVRTHGATPFRDVSLESNTVTGSHCTFDMTVDDDGGLKPTGGATRILGGSFEGDVRLGNQGMVVQGLKVGGTLTYSASASGVVLNNTAGTTVTKPGSQMVDLLRTLP